MNTTVEISVVVLIAATMAFFSLMICLLERRSKTLDADLQTASLWLAAANIALLTAAIALLFHQSMPFWLAACIITCGAHLGILFGFFGMHSGLAARPQFALFGSLGAVNIALQWSFALMGPGAVALFITTSIMNGLITLAMGIIIFRLSLVHTRELRLLVSFPFFVISFGYVLRLVLLILGASPPVLITATALIAFMLAYSALQWCFGLIALRAARLNLSLELERQRAQELADARARFLAHMSHEIRTPLNSVIGMADVLQGIVKDQRAQEMVGHIQQSGDFLIHILNDILDVSKLQANALTLEQRPFDVDALLRQIRASLSPQCRDRGLSLIVDIHPQTSGKWLGDPHRINQILQNVVGNAVKFTENGSVSVSASGTDQLRIVVEDTGIGMDDAQMATMFDEFSQADEGITRRFGGTGLGMTIVHRLVSVMGGKIDVKSQIGVGTRIMIDLPLSRAEGSDTAPLAAIPTPISAFGSLRVLCADDSKGNLLVLCAMLEQLGISPQTATDGHAALRIAEQENCDLYLLDISMPGFSGIETLHRLRTIEADRARPLAYAVAATANALSSDLDIYLASGFDAHLPKPIRLDALRQVLLAARESQADGATIQREAG